MSEREFSQRAMRCAPKLWRIAYLILRNGADCDDAVQEALLRAWAHIGSLRDPALFETWLVRILVNECKDALRRRRRDPVALEADIGREDRLCEDLQLRLALRQLPEKYRLPLVLHHLQGWPVADVAAMLGIPKALATSRLHQARKALRALLDGGDD